MSYPNMEVGVYPYLSNNDYHAGPGLSKSGLDRLARSPAHFRYAEREDLPQFVLGSAFHCAVLEPEQFRRRYAVSVDADRRTKAGKEAWAAFEQSLEGRTVLSAEQWDTVERMRDAVYANARYREILDLPGYVEASAYWTDPETGVLCKCRPDKVLGSAGLMLDLKSTTDASQHGFSYSAGKYRYWVQAPWYADGWRHASGEQIDMFLFLAVEKTPPFGVGLYELPKEAEIRGRMEYRRLLPVYARCMRDDVWPGYPAEIRGLEIPRYFF